MWLPRPAGAATSLESKQLLTLVNFARGCAAVACHVPSIVIGPTTGLLHVGPPTAKTLDESMLIRGLLGALGPFRSLITFWLAVKNVLKGLPAEPSLASSPTLPST